MAKLPSWRRVFEQDYPQQYQDLIKKLAVSLNYGMDTLYQTLNNGLTFADNIKSTINTFQVKVDSTGKPTTTVTITKSNTSNIIGLIVVKAVNLTNSNSYVTNAPFVSYTETTNTLVINNITGLIAGNSYNITVLGIN
jgi:hypothetical protein